MANPIAPEYRRLNPPEPPLIGISDDQPPTARLWLIGLGLLGVVASWPGADFAPRLGTDPGWQLGINLVPEFGLQHGDDVLWAYGPLGPLVQPLALDGFTMAASLITWLLIHAVLVAALISLLRIGIGDTAAAALAVLLLLTFPEQFIPERWSVALIVYALAYATQSLPRAMRAATPYVLGASIALLFCAKAGAGLPAGVIVVAAVWWVGRLRALIITLVSGLLTLLGVWLLTGNSVSTIGSYVTGSIELVSRFSDAMAATKPTFVQYSRELTFDYISVAAFAAVIFGAWWFRRRAYPTSRLVAALAAVAAWHWFRYSYVRPDGRTAIVFWFLALVATVLISSHREHLKVGIVISVACIAFSAGISDRSLLAAFDLSQGVTNLNHHFLLAISPDARQGVLEEARTALKKAFAIPDELVEQLRTSAGVHVDSYHLTTVWTYDLPWMPVPVFQSYSAYSEGLDARNADALVASPSGHAILRRNETAIDVRFRRFESPAYMTEMACRYNHESTRAGWQVLLKGENRCGEARLVDVVDVDNGDVVSIPEVSTKTSMMIARVHLGSSLVYEIQRLIFKPLEEAEVLLDGVAYRFVRGTSTGPLILTYPENPSFALGHLQSDGLPSYGTIAFRGLYSPTVIEFLEIPVEFE